MDVYEIKSDAKQYIVKLIDNKKVDLDKVEYIPDKFLLNLIKDIVDLNKNNSNSLKTLFKS